MEKKELFGLAFIVKDEPVKLKLSSFISLSKIINLKKNVIATTFI